MKKQESQLSQLIKKSEDNNGLLVAVRNGAITWLSIQQAGFELVENIMGVSSGRFLVVDNAEKFSDKEVQQAQKWASEGRMVVLYSRESNPVNKLRELLGNDDLKSFKVHKQSATDLKHTDKIKSSTVEDTAKTVVQTAAAINTARNLSTGASFIVKKV